MAIIKCLLTIILLFVISKSLALQNSTAVNPYRLPKHFVPLQYDIKLIPYISENEKNFTFDGEANIILEVLVPTDTIILHISELTINESMTKLWPYKISIDNPAYECCEPTSFLVNRHEYNNDTQMLTINFDDRLYSNKLYKLYLNFTGLIQEEMYGIYRTFYIDNEGNQIWMAATFFQPIYARKAFPCFDEPAIKSSFIFSIKHYPNYTALSNMPSTQSEVDPIDGKLWSYFEATPIMSTNILGFVIADYNYVMVEGSTKIWGPKHLLQHAQESVSAIKQATRELERFTESIVLSYVPKMDHVAIPQYPALGLESWGMIAYRQDVLLVEKSHTDKLNNVNTIVHELAHQWFGNLVSPAWWNYVWLSEGMATYLSFYIADTIWKESRFMDFFIAKYVLGMFSTESDCLTPWKSICTSLNLNVIDNSDIQESYSPDAYTKSAALLRMLSHFLREDVFRIGLKKYIKKHKYKSVTPDDLWEALQDALDESDVPHNDFKVKEVMDTWFNQSVYPVVKIDRYYTGEIIATQHKRVPFRNIIETEKNNAWWIPLNCITKSNLNSSSTLATHWLTPQKINVIIEGVDKEDWIIVNKQFTGYYRVNYDETNWKLIADFLNSDDYNKIHIFNRVQIINDVYYMMETEGLDFTIFFNVIKYLWREIDLTVWYPALPVIESIATSYLRIPQGATIFKPYFFNLTYKLFEHIGFDGQVHDTTVTKEIRSNFIKFACLYDIHPECREKAIVKLLKYVEKPITEEMLENERNIICFGLMKANESIWELFLKINGIGTVVKFLGCSENLDIVERHFMILKYYFSSSYLFLIMYDNMPVNVDAIPLIIRHYKTAAENLSKLSEVPPFIISIFRQIIDYFNEDDIQKVKCIFENRTLIFKDEYFDDRIKKINKIRDNISNIRRILKDNSNYYF